MVICKIAANRSASVNCGVFRKIVSREEVSLSGCPVLRSVELVPEAQPNPGRGRPSELSDQDRLGRPSSISSCRTWLFK